MSPYSERMTDSELSARVLALAKRMEQDHNISRPYVIRDVNGLEKGPETEASIILYLRHILDAWEGEQ